MTTNHPTTSTAVESAGSISATSLGAIIASPSDPAQTSASGAPGSQPAPSSSSVQPKQEQSSGGETHSPQPINCSFGGEIGTASIAGSAAQSTALNTMHDLTTTVASPALSADTTAVGSVFRCLFPNCLHLSATSQAAREHIRAAHLQVQADIPTGHALEQYFTVEEIPRIAPAAATVFTHLPGIHRHMTPSPSSTTAATPAPTLTLPDTIAAMQPVPSPPSAAAAAAGLATPPPTAQFYQVSQPAVRHPHWQSATWPAAPTGMNCSPPPPTPGSSPYVYQQAAMATLPGTSASFEALPSQTRLVDPTAAALAAGALPTTVYSMPVQSSARIARRDLRADGTTIPRVRSDGRKCRKVYGMENRDKWCTQCRWKKACVRFVD